MKHSNLIGIDISDSSIKVLQLDAENNIIAYGTDTFPNGVVEQGLIVQEDIFSQKLNHLLEHTKPHVLRSEQTILRAVVCLPESKLFTHYLTVPNEIKKADIAAYIRDDAEKIIPFTLDTMYWDYHVVDKNGERRATFAGVPKSDLDNYVTALTHAHVKPAFVGGELFSLGRALLPDNLDGEDSIIIDIGAHSTTIGIFANDAIANVSVKVSRGGDYFTEAIAQKLAIPIEEAETLKRQYGLDMQYEKTGIPQILDTCIDELIEKLNDAKTYFEGKTGNSVKHIIVAGGSALLPNICTHIQEKTRIDTHIANPLLKIKNSEILGKDIPTILFSNVIGLALHGIDSDFAPINFLTHYQYEESDTEKEMLSVSDIRSWEDLRYVFSGGIQRIGSIATRVQGFVKRKIPKIPMNSRLLLSVAIVVAALAFLVWVLITYTS